MLKLGYDIELFRIRACVTDLHNSFASLDVLIRHTKHATGCVMLDLGLSISGA